MRKSVGHIVGSQKGYDELVAAMQNAELPVCLQHEDPMNAGITLNDLRDFSIQFREDSGLDIEFTFYTCTNCNRLHMLMIVKDPNEQEEYEEE